MKAKPKTRKPKRAKKSRKERARLEKHSTTRIVGEGFVQRVRKPQRTGKRVKSVMLRVDAAFAEYVRDRAATDGSITEVTRKILDRLKLMDEAAREAAERVDTPKEGGDDASNV